MGYPMTYLRLVNRNGLVGDYAESLIAGDLRRLEKDQRDERHLSLYAAYAGVTCEQAARVLEAFFTDFAQQPLKEEQT